MWVLEWLLSLLLFPVTWFWNVYNDCKESKSIWKLIIFFLMSFSGLLLFMGSFLWFLAWVFTYHFDVIVIIGLIIWLYAYVKSKMDNNAEPQEVCSQEILELEEQAINTYPTMRNIMYQTLKECAENIGGVVPRLLTEIEVLERHYIISQNICFFQFRLEKADIRMRYQKEDLREFERILQSTISRKIQAKEFPILGIEKFLDSYGNVYDAVYIDTIEDMDNCFVIQSVLYSPTYADYLRAKKINEQSTSAVAIPDADWKPRQ